MNKSTNNFVVPGAKQAIEKMKYEIASELGVSQRALVSKVGKKESFTIDDIVVDEKATAFMAKKEEKIASLPNGLFKKVISKVSKKRKVVLFIGEYL